MGNFRRSIETLANLRVTYRREEKTRQNQLLNRDLLAVST